MSDLVSIIMPSYNTAQYITETIQSVIDGIPLITSDLPVCREIFEKIPSVAFMNNEIENENFSQIYVNILKEYRSLLVNISTLYGKHICYILVMSEYCILDCWMELY